MQKPRKHIELGDTLSHVAMMDIYISGFQNKEKDEESEEGKLLKLLEEEKNANLNKRENLHTGESG